MPSDVRAPTQVILPHAPRRVRLRVGVGGLEGGQGGAEGFGAKERRVWRQVEIEAARVVELGDEVDVGEGGSVADQEDTGRLGGGALEGGEAARREVALPVHGIAA